ncbi:MAG: MoaD/ThiS family protein [Thermostichus sp. DG02_5_bins_236]
MATKILIPSPLRPYTDNQETVEIDGSNVGEVMSNLIARYADLKRHLYTEEGKLRNFVNVYLNDEDVRDLAEGDNTPVGEKATISIVPAIAGGF